VDTELKFSIFFAFFANKDIAGNYLNNKGIALLALLSHVKNLHKA